MCAARFGVHCACKYFKCHFYYSNDDVVGKCCQEGIARGRASKQKQENKKIVQGLVGVNKCLTSCWFFALVFVGIALYRFCCAASIFRAGERVKTTTANLT